MKTESKQMFNLLINYIYQSIIWTNMPQPFEPDLTQDLERNNDITQVISLLTSDIGGDEFPSDSCISFNLCLNDHKQSHLFLVYQPNQ